MTDLPAVLRTLVDRFDASAFDAPAGRARIRLVVSGEGEWDALVAADGLSVVDAGRNSVPDATLSADPRPGSGSRGISAAGWMPIAPGSSSFATTSTWASASSPRRVASPVLHASDSSASTRRRERSRS
jgi:hypothetical protein